MGIKKSAWGWGLGTVGGTLEAVGLKRREEMPREWAKSERKRFLQPWVKAGKLQTGYV